MRLSNVSLQIKLVGLTVDGVPWTAGQNRLEQKRQSCCFQVPRTEGHVWNFLLSRVRSEWRFAKIQKHQKSSARKSSIRDFNGVRSQFPKPICQGHGILFLFGTKTKVVKGKLEKGKRQDDVLVTGNFVDVAEVQNDDEFSDYDGECKSHDVCEYLRIVDSKHCVNSDTSAVPAQTAGQMIHLGRRPSVVSIILDLNAAEKTVYAFIVSSGICHKIATRMLKIIRDPAFFPTNLRFANLTSMHYRMYLAQEYDLHCSDMHRTGDGNQELKLWFRKAGEALHQRVKSKRWGTHMTWHYAQSYNKQGDRTFRLSTILVAWKMLQHKRQLNCRIGRTA